MVAGDLGGGRHAHDRRVLAAVGAHRHELEPLQAVHAPIAARGRRSGAATARRSWGTRDRASSKGRSPPTRLTVGPAQPGDVEAVGAVAMRQQLGARARARASPRSASRRSITPSLSAREIVQTEYTSVPPGLSAAAPARRISSCSAASSEIASGLARQRRSGRDCSVPRPLHGGSTSTRSKPAIVARDGRVGDLDAHGRAVHPGARSPRARARDAGSARPRRRSLGSRSAPPGAWSCRPARRTDRAPARRAPVPSIRATVIEPRDWGMIAPSRQSERALGVERGFEHEALGQPWGRTARHAECAPRPRRAGRPAC